MQTKASDFIESVENIKEVERDTQGKGFVVLENRQIPQKTSFKVNETIKNNLHLQTDILRADLEKLKNSHPELFQTKGAVARLINKIQENPTFFFENNRLDMKIVGAYVKNNFGELGIVTHGENIGDIGHILETSKTQKRINSLKNRDKNSPLAETATLDTLPYNKADGRNGEVNSLLESKSNSTTNHTSLSKNKRTRIHKI